MNKKELAKMIRGIMSGVDSMTCIAYGKEKGKWVYECNTSGYCSGEYNTWGWDWVAVKKHCCNNMSLKEAMEIINESELESINFKEQK